MISLHDLYFIILLVVVGLIAGYAAGLFGIGGGVVLVPALLVIFPAFGTSKLTVMHCAVGTSLALLVPTSFVSVRKHIKLNNFDRHLFNSWVPYVVIGAMVALFLMNSFSATVLKTFFVIYLYFSIAVAVLKSERKSSTEFQPRGIVKSIGGFFVGAYSTLLGMGGGVFTVPFLKLFNYPIKKAIAISSATAIFIGLVGTVGSIYIGLDLPGRAPYSIGYVNALAFIIVTPFTILAAPWGVKLSNALPKRRLKWSYVIFLIVIAIYMTMKVFDIY